MRNLLNFLARYNNLIIFLILEGVAVYLLATGHYYHNSLIVKSIRSLSVGVEEKVNNTRTYLNLRKINESLAAENLNLRKRIEGLSKSENLLFSPVNDTLHKQKYQYTYAEVINNSVNRQKNFFTLNKGEYQGIQPDMAVTSGNCVAGIIVASSRDFSIAMSLLNLDFKVSARIKSNGYFGSLSWDGRDSYHAVLNEIPQHVQIMEGDTIETTGYSAIFPEGVLIGTVSDFKKMGGDFYKINISLMTDFRNLHYVNVIGNMKKTEQHELENSF